jgi:hypothetical protein
MDLINSHNPKINDAVHAAVDHFRPDLVETEAEKTEAA